MFKGLRLCVMYNQHSHPIIYRSSRACNRNGTCWLTLVNVNASVVPTSRRSSTSWSPIGDVCWYDPLHSSTLELRRKIEQGDCMDIVPWTVWEFDYYFCTQKFAQAKSYGKVCLTTVHQAKILQSGKTHCGWIWIELKPIWPSYI